MSNRRFLYITAASMLTAGALNMQSAIVINEALMSNSSYPVNGDDCDWVELYNTGTEAVNLGGMTLSLASGKSYMFTDGTILAAGEYYMALCDSGSSSDGYTGFRLSASGDTINLYSSDSTLLDTLDYGAQVTDFSVGRFPNGTGAFTLCIPTVGDTNQKQTTGSISLVKVNECCAGPDDWFELYNTSDSNPVALGGFYLTNKPKKNPSMFQIPPLTFVGKKGFVLFYADEDTTAGKDHVNFKLGKSGDKIALTDGTGDYSYSVLEYPEMVDYQAFGLIPDGSGSGIIQPGKGTPGASNYLELGTVVLNEIFTHSDFDEGATDPDFIELKNISTVAVNISGWGLSDSYNNLKKYVFPAGTVIQPGALLTVTDLEFNDEDNENCNEAFRLNSYEGDSAYLTQFNASGTATGYRSQVSFGAAPNNFSFVRYVNGDGDVDYPLGEYTTMDRENAPVKIGPVVINEIHFKPAGDTEPTEDEFVELFNITDQEVPLYYSTNPNDAAMLANGIEYTFPAGTTIAPGAYVIVVSFNPTSATATSFRTKFNVSEDVLLYGPYSGKLSNDGEAVELLFPDKPEGKDSNKPGMIPYYLVDKVLYSPSAPWPEDAKGSGKSLQRLNAFVYGNQSSNWGTYGGSVAADVVSAGRRSTVGTTDQDGDQMPDDWELTYQLDPFDPLDAALDANGDGVTNLQHYLNGTSPIEVVDKDPVTLTIALTAEVVTISFEAQSSTTYAVQVSASADGDWVLLETIESGEARTVTVDDALQTRGARFYRVITN